MKSLLHQNVMILGLGISGLAMARWCARFGANVTVVDTRANPPQLELLKSELPAVKFVSSQFESSLVENQTIQYLLISPGIKPSDVADIVATAKRQELIVCNELTLFTMALNELKEANAYRPHVLAITGTNGKTTVTSLTGQLVACAKMSVAVAGNIGPSLLDTLSAKLDASTLPEVWVLELSSFQLNDASDFEPTIGVVLNISQDHLDWHGTMVDYKKAKSHVYGTRSTMIMNRDDDDVMMMLANARKTNKHRKYCTFGSDTPSRLGDYGLESVNGMTWLVRATSTEDSIQKKQRSFIEPARELNLQRLIPADALQIRGQHNMLNALAALAMAELTGCGISRILYGLRDYKGEPHRVESIGVFNGIEYFDDSKGTNVGATVAAISGLGQERKIIAILGGEGKGQDFSPLSDIVRKYARAVVLIGKDKMTIAESLSVVNIEKIFANTMSEAVSAAANLAHVNDAVLLSPACASFDMFKDYGHRGHVFKLEVLKFHQIANDVVKGNEEEIML